jgi:hypothetical protein
MFRLVHLPTVFSLASIVAQGQTSFQNSVYAGFPLRAQADLNRDGAPDLIGIALSGTENAQFEVLLSRGHGTYAPAIPYDTINNEVAEGYAVGDFNEDGNADLAVSICACGNPQSQSGIEIFFGRGDGTLIQPTKKWPSPYAINLQAADVNHDGNLDLVLINTDNTVSVMAGKGDGTFSPSTAVYTPANGFSLDPNTLLTGDFDGDTNADFLTYASSCTPQACSEERVTLFGNGHAVFSPVVTSVPNDVPFTSVADVNQDGKSDLLYFIGGDPPKFAVLYGNGSRTFQTKTYSAAPQPWIPSGAMTVADFNGDGINDVAYQASPVGVSETDLLVQLGTVGGSFAAPISETFSEDSSSPVVFVGDYRPDQKPDVAAMTSSGSETVIDILLNTTSGNFSDCSTPKPKGIRVCSPKAGTVTSSPVSFDISGASFAPIRKIETWVDGKKVSETYYGWDVKAFSRFSFNLGAGKHHVDVYSANYDNTLQHKGLNFTVQ